jgi:hypothetical protein
MLYPTSRALGIFAFLPPTKLHKYITPIFAISCHHKIGSVHQQEYEQEIKQQDHSLMQLQGIKHW